jgi:ATP-dependent RNA helicase DDX24/MAK5
MKRPHGTQDKKGSHKVYKRQKLEKKKAPRPEIPIPKRKINLHDLGWNPVSMPDRLEDFEGFYGLEEIEDVHVVKDAVTGNISFETTKTEEQIEQDIEKAWQREEEEAKHLEAITFGGEAKDGEEKEGVEEDVEEEVEAEEPPKDVEQDDDAGSWGGFSDDEEVAQNGEEPAEHLTTTTKDAPSATNDTSIKPQEVNGEGKQEKKLNKRERAAEKRRLAALAEKAAERNESDIQEDEEVSEGETFGAGAFDILANRADDEDDEVDVSEWEELALSTKVLDALSKLKFSKPTTIQASTIPEIMAGRDVVGKASTGSGKTLAFGIPIIETFLTSKKHSKEDHLPLALIIAPTRELAHQITDHLIALCSKGDFEAPKIASVTGGLAVQKQRRQLETADIIVGTPGRLWEVISTGQGLLDKVKQIRFLVVDEADRLLSQGNYKELGQILQILEKDAPAEADAESEDSSETARQTLVFSATFQKNLQQKLAGKAKAGGSDNLMSKQQSMEYLLKKLNFREEKPMFIDANPQSQMASKLKEGLIECAGTEKDLYLYSLLMFYPKKRALIFTNSISAVRRITPFLQNLALPALPLHSSMAQKARLRSIERFKERPGSILVATDVAARGLDIPRVELVIHYHLPRAADTYVHRSGRTARADASGSSILICAPEEVAGVRRLIAKVHARADEAPKSKKTAYFIRTLDIDRRIVSRLKPRATISKKLADMVIAKEKSHSENDVLKQAAEDLGVDYDSDEFEKEARGKKGRGTGRKKKEKEASQMTKGEQQALRAELKGMLRERINTGVSARYLTSGGIDVEALLAGEGNSEFLGNVDGLGFDDEE